MSQTSPNPARRSSVFISYHRVSATDFAQRLIAELERAGHASWIDTIALKGGDEWIKGIVAGLNKSDALLVLANTGALQSHWVRKEMLFAIKKQKPIIPLLLEAGLSDEDAFLLLEYQSISFVERDFAAAFADLLRALSNLAVPVALPPVTRGVPAELPRELVDAYLDRLTLEELVSTDKYTPLGGASQQHPQPLARQAEMRAVFELMPLRLGKAPHEPQAPRKFENAVEEILKRRRAVLLGEPGGGKTTTLWKLAAELVERARQNINAPIPLLIRLGRWTDAEQDLPVFIAGQLGELGTHLDELLKTKRAALLLDGLNELPAAQHKDKYRQVQAFIQQHPALLAVVSCRALDYTLDLKFDRINITPLDPPRIQEFVKHYLGGEQGEALFWKLAGGAALRPVWEVWEKAGASFEQFFSAPEIPKTNPDVYSQTSGEQDRLWQEKVRGQHSQHSLMELARNPYMLLMLASVYAEQQELPDNRGELFQLFVETLLRRERIPDEEQTPLTDGLARVAYEMQMRRATAQPDDETSGALTVLPKTAVLPWLNERLLYLAGCASLLSVGDEVRFSHQLLQEYFAAKYMDGEINAGRLSAASIWPPDRWWARTNWEEAAILLAGLHSDDCSPVVEWLAEAQPELAARCINRSGAALADATRARLREQWPPLLADLKRTPAAKARAALGRELTLAGLDNRPGVGRTRAGLPDLEWKEIPGGAFQYGLANDTWAAKPRKLELPAFWISRYPLTYAQFRCFAEDNGYGDPRWWEGLAADEDGRQPAEQSFKFDNHPRDTVNWYEAIAFCRWLSWRWGGGYDLRKIDEWKVRLPTEFEWEKAARGPDGRIYPYTGEFDSAKGNVHQTGIGQTSAVGIFPNGASPYGVEEMSGNVWEWCLSDYDKPQEKARNENLDTNNNRVLRGGSWFGDVGVARAVGRRYSAPGYRYYNPGFRLAVVCPPS